MLVTSAQLLAGICAFLGILIAFQDFINSKQDYTLFSLSCEVLRSLSAHLLYPLTLKEDFFLTFHHFLFMSSSLKLLVFPQESPVTGITDLSLESCFTLATERSPGPFCWLLS